MPAIPLLLGILVGLLLGLLTWGWSRVRHHVTGDLAMESRDDVLVSLLLLAAFACGAFATYLLLKLGP